MHTYRISVFNGLVAVLIGLVAPAALADEYADQWGPRVGTAMPLLAANDHTGAPRELSNLAGDKGLLLFLNRSADW